MCGSSRQNSVVWTAILATVLAFSGVDASSWPSDSSSGSGKRPDPPGYSGRPPPPKREEDGLYQADVYGTHEEDRRPPDSSTYHPIHYQFRATDDVDIRRRPAVGRDLSDGVPVTELDRETFVKKSEDDDLPYASARTDVITRYISTRKGRVLLTLSSGVVGAALGSFLGKVSDQRNVRFFILIFVSYSDLSRITYLAHHAHIVTHESCFAIESRVCQFVYHLHSIAQSLW